jgi:hypothetical protein
MLQHTKRKKDREIEGPLVATPAKEQIALINPLAPSLDISL